MLIEQQIGERQARAKNAVAKIVERPADAVFGDYKIKSGSGRIYRVAMRGAGAVRELLLLPGFRRQHAGNLQGPFAPDSRPVSDEGSP